jgi:hypothetical protein
MAQKRLVEIVLQGKDETKGAFDSLAKSLGLADAKALKLAAGAAAVGTALITATKQVYDFVAQAARLGAEFDDLAQRNGVAVEGISELLFVVQRGGGSVGDLEGAVRRLSRSMGDARGGVAGAVDSFSRLGIEASQLVDGRGNLREIEQILPMIADGIQQLGSQAERIDIARTLLGRGGVRLLPALQEGSAAIREMRIEMEKYGGAMSTEFAVKAGKFEDAQDNLTHATQRLKEALAEPFLGPFTAAVNKLAETIAGAREFVAGDGSGPGAQRQPGTVASDNTGVTVGEVGGWYDINPETGLPYQPWEVPEPSYVRRGRTRNPIFGNPNLGGVPPSVYPPSGPRDWSAPPDPYERIMDPNYDMTGFDWGSQQEALDGLTSGMDNLVESTNKFSEAGQIAAATFQSALSSAFATAIMDADNAAEMIANIFKSTFASLAGSLLSAAIFSAIGLPVYGPFAALFGKSVSAETKAMPGPIQLGGAGAYMSHAMAAHGKAYI